MLGRSSAPGAVTRRRCLLRSCSIPASPLMTPDQTSAALGIKRDVHRTVNRDSRHRLSTLFEKYTVGVIVLLLAYQMITWARSQMGTALGRGDVHVRFHVRSSRWGFPTDTESACSVVGCTGPKCAPLAGPSLKHRRQHEILFSTPRSATCHRCAEALRSVLPRAIESGRRCDEGDE